MDKLERCLEGIHRIELIQNQMQKDIARNTEDLEEHIRRTELLEKKLSKIYTASFIVLGYLTSHFGPGIFKIIGGL